MSDDPLRPARGCLTALVIMLVVYCLAGLLLAYVLTR